MVSAPTMCVWGHLLSPHRAGGRRAAAASAIFNSVVTAGSSRCRIRGEGDAPARRCRTCAVAANLSAQPTADMGCSALIGAGWHFAGRATADRMMSIGLSSDKPTVRRATLPPAASLTSSAMTWPS